MEKNILLVIEYDGTNFHGWQIQPNERTVQGEIEHVLKFLGGEEVSIHGTSRTDAGVHALGQCASLKWNSPIDTDKLPWIMNKRFGVGGLGRSGAPGDIKIISATEMPEDFHARYSCTRKTYRYLIERDGDIFRRNMAFQLAESLDVAAMRIAAEHIVGTHDFKSFEAAGGTPRETTVRTISDLEISECGERISIEITGDGFLYNMVRIIVGTLVETGMGKRLPSEMSDVIAGRDRALAGFTAPPQGLYLKEIYFE